jgi:hypothetical protein
MRFKRRCPAGHNSLIGSRQLIWLAYGDPAKPDDAAAPDGAKARVATERNKAA